MPLAVSIVERDRLVHIVLEGLVSIDEFLKKLDETFADPRFQTGMNGLIDLREATHHADIDDIARIAMYAFKHYKRFQGGKAAVVVSRTVSYGLMRMFQMRVDALPFGMAVFYDMDEATDWLGIAPRGTLRSGA